MGEFEPQRKKHCLAKEVDDPFSINEAKLFAELGHEFRVYTNVAISSTSCKQSASYDEEADDFYDLGPEDYHRLTFHGMGAQPGVLKVCKVREAKIAEREAHQRATVSKAIIRVRFPDNCILEAKFQSSDKLQSLMDLLKKVIARPDLPFYLYTTPPKQLIKDFSMDFYTAGFAPGANVYFSYDISVGSELNNSRYTGFYLGGDILSLDRLKYPIKNVCPVLNEHEASFSEKHGREEQVEASSMEIPAEHKPFTKKPTKPKDVGCEDHTSRFIPFDFSRLHRQLLEESGSVVNLSTMQ